NAPLEVRVEVLLVAPLVRLEDDLVLGHLEVVGHVEEVADHVAEGSLPTFLDDVLLQDHHAVGLLRLRRLVIELGDLLGLEPLVEIPVLANERLLDARLLCATLVLEDSLRLSLELFKFGLWEAIRQRNQRFAGVVAEHESNTVLRPSVEMLREREVGVAAEQDVG